MPLSETPSDEASQFFLSTLLYTDQPHTKNATHPWRGLMVLESNIHPT